MPEFQRCASSANGSTGVFTFGFSTSGRCSTIAEVWYGAAEPQLRSEGRGADQHDAYSVVVWLTPDALPGS